MLHQAYNKSAAKQQRFEIVASRQIIGMKKAAGQTSIRPAALPSQWINGAR